MKRNPIARDLRTPKYRQRVILDKRAQYALCEADAQAAFEAFCEAEQSEWERQSKCECYGCVTMRHPCVKDPRR